MIRMRQQLDLTDDQVKRLEAMRGASAPAMNPADRLRAQADIMDATRGDINMEKARAAFDRMAKTRTDQQLGRLKIQQDARNVLTPAQKAKVDAMRGQMRGGKGKAGGQKTNKMRKQMRKQMMRQRLGGMMGRRQGGKMQPGQKRMQPGQMQPGMNPGQPPMQMRRPPPPDSLR